MMHRQSFILLQGELAVAIAGISPLQAELPNKEIQLGDKITSAHRKEQFLTGRQLAHSLCKQQGHPNLPILRDSNGAPEWPCDIKGSISHNSTHAAAAILVPHTKFRNIGIDMEYLYRDINPKILPKILTARELETFCNSENFSLEARIIFCLKESLFKCIYPAMKEYFGFYEAEILKLENNIATIQLSKSLQEKGFPEQISGGWQQIEGDLLLTWVVR